MDEQQRLNNEIDSRTIATRDKFGETSTNLALVTNRADCLQHGQDELAVSFRQQGQKMDQWQNDQSKMNQLLGERGARNEERQLCFIGEQKTINENVTKLTGGLIDKLSDNITKLEVINVRAAHLSEGQNKLDLLLRQTEQTADERLRDQYKFNLSITDQSSRIDEKQNSFMASQKSFNEQMFSAQKQMNELLMDLSNQLTESLVRTKSIESRFETFLLDQKRLSEMCIKFGEKLDGFEKRLGELDDEESAPRGCCPWNRTGSSN